jgi:O-acetyl-ADP-ribose deacetylase (regulator of RNase III)
MTADVFDRIELVTGDITLLAVDVIVNAANSSLMGGGGVDGAIHAAAGPGLLAECANLNGCPTGAARITGGHRLRARWVIHTVGPIWNGGSMREDDLLARCYQSSLVLAREVEATSIAFPAISTGVYRFPRDRAAAIAVRSVAGMLADLPRLRRVLFVSFSADMHQLYELVLRGLRSSVGAGRTAGTRPT